MTIALVLLGSGVRDPGLSGLDRGIAINFGGGRKLLNLMLRLSIVLLVTVMTFAAVCGVLALEFAEPQKRPTAAAAAGPSGAEAKAVDDNENRLRGIDEDLQKVKMELSDTKQRIDGGLSRSGRTYASTPDVSSGARNQHDSLNSQTRERTKICQSTEDSDE